MNTCIYYPRLSPSPGWLKTAALCWDKVYTLFPRHKERNDLDPPALQDLDRKLGGVLEKIPVSSLEREVYTAFEKWLQKNVRRLTKANRFELQPQETGDTAEVLTIKDLDWSCLSAEKFIGPDQRRRDMPTVRELLERHGLARFCRRKETITVPRWEVEARTSWESSRALFPHEGTPDPFTFDDKTYFIMPKIEHPLTRRKSTAYSDYYKLKSEAEHHRQFIGDKSRAELLDRKADAIRTANLVTVDIEQEVVYLPQEIALHYLSLCAAKAADQQGRDLVAENARFTDTALLT